MLDEEITVNENDEGSIRKEYDEWCNAAIILDDDIPPEFMSSEEELEFILQNYDVSYTYPDYSGRGMFGKECVGVVISKETYYDLNEYGLTFAHLTFAHVDNMGSDVILYWRDLNQESLSDELKTLVDSHKEDDEDNE